MTDTNPGCWPDAARPGVPMNSEQFRAHRIRWYGDEQDWLWHPERRVWIGRLAVHYSALDVGLTRGAVYLGPCHTPAEVAALVEAARREERKANLQILARWGAWAGGPDCPDQPRDVERITEASAEIGARGDA
jgi:hypothetical protein